MATDVTTLQPPALSVALIYCVILHGVKSESQDGRRRNFGKPNSGPDWKVVRWRVSLLMRQISNYQASLWGLCKHGDVWTGSSKQQRLIADDFSELIKQRRLFALGQKTKSMRDEKSAALYWAPRGSSVCCASLLSVFTSSLVFTDTKEHKSSCLLLLFVEFTCLCLV